MCFHLKRKFREVVMKGRGKLGREREIGVGVGVGVGERKGFATMYTSLTNLLSSLCHHTPDRF